MSEVRPTGMQPKEESKVANRDRAEHRACNLLQCIYVIDKLCHVSAYSGTSGNNFEYKNVLLNGAQENDSINHVRMG